MYCTLPSLAHVDTMARWARAIALVQGTRPSRSCQLSAQLWSACAHTSPEQRPALALWLLPSVAGGRSPSRCAELIAATAQLIDLMTGQCRLWSGPTLDADHLDDNAVIKLLSARAKLGPALRNALTGPAHGVARSRESRALLASPAYRRCVAGAIEQAAQTLLDCREPGIAPLVHEFANEMYSRHERVARSIELYAALESARSSALATHTPVPTRAGSAAQPDPLVAARAHLARDSLHSEAWDSYYDDPRAAKASAIAHWFPRGMVAQVEGELGWRPQSAIRALLRELPNAALRYFPEWPTMPPDSDSLGLMLSLASRVRSRPLARRVQSWLEPLLQYCPPDQPSPTWLQSPQQRQLEPWAGQDCCAVRMRLSLGLLQWDARAHAERIHINMRALLRQHERWGRFEHFYYDRAYTELLFMQLAQAYLDRGESVSAHMQRRISRLGRVLVRGALASEALHGAFGAPQATACRMQLLALAGSDPDAIARARRYLAATQHSDGSWPAEAIYVTMARHGETTWHRSKSLTTAVCASALAASRSMPAPGR